MLFTVRLQMSLAVAHGVWLGVRGLFLCCHSSAGAIEVWSRLANVVLEMREKAARIKRGGGARLRIPKLWSRICLG